MSVNRYSRTIKFGEFSLSLLVDLEYAKVKVMGEFLHDHEFYVQPRQRFDKGESHSFDFRIM